VKGIAVIIPVYNAFKDALECVHSVLAQSSEAERILVIDDCSPEGDLAKCFSDAGVFDPRLEVIRNTENLGFVATCNSGMRLARNLDVVLLNSDTVVTPRWLKKMQAAAYSKREIGTVTPFTNNGNICSFPRWCEDNSIPRNMTLNEYAQIIEDAAAREYPKLPTCVGFCVYIKREVLEKVGLFDEVTFGRGYGEENDLSCRAQAAGFFDVLDDATFIQHKGSLSFKAEKAALIARNEVALQRKHPHYFGKQRAHWIANPLRDAQRRAKDALVAAWQSNRKSVLHIVQNGPFTDRRGGLGGTEYHVQEIIRCSEDLAHWSLVPGNNCYFLTAHVEGVDVEFVLELNRTSLKNILSPEFFDIVHLHHSRYLDHLELCDAIKQHGNYYVGLNDYILVCPRFHLYTPFRRVCSGKECSTECAYAPDYVKSYRSAASEMLSSARRVFAFSNSTVSWLNKILGPQTNIEVIPHGIRGFRKGRAPISVRQPSVNEPFRVLFLGQLPQHKGSLIIEEMIRNSQIAGQPVEWHVLGKLFLETDKVINHGSYNPVDLPEKISKILPHVVVILSICPETYCLTLDEAWNAGVTVVVTPLGAPAERVRDSGAGWVLDSLAPKAVLERLGAIARDWDEYLLRRSKIPGTKIRSSEDEGRQYHGIYREASNFGKASWPALAAYLGLFRAIRDPEPSEYKRFGGRIVDRVIKTLEKTRLRPKVEALAYKLMPTKVLERIKVLRQTARG
jgi:GT2 family glycosyltransferase